MADRETKTELSITHTDGTIEFYADLPGGREVGFLNPIHPEHKAALEAMAAHQPAMTLRGPVPPSIVLPESRVKELLVEGKTWGLFARIKQGRP